MGLGLGEFIEDFYDTVAFQSFRTTRGGPRDRADLLVHRAPGHEHAHDDGDRHDTRSATLDQLFALIDPLAWSNNSDVIEDDLVRRRSMGSGHEGSGTELGARLRHPAVCCSRTSASDLGSMRSTVADSPTS